MFSVIRAGDTFHRDSETKRRTDTRLEKHAAPYESSAAIFAARSYIPGKAGRSKLSVSRYG